MCENTATKHQQAIKLGGGFAPQGRTVWTTSAHIITVVIGSGVLSLAWATAQLGWIAGPTVLFLFSFVTYYTSCLLAAC
ncbi:putative amino acid transporter, transmembrane domain-containing protein [Helianthus anomalus]